MKGLMIEDKQYIKEIGISCENIFATVNGTFSLCEYPNINYTYALARNQKINPDEKYILTAKLYLYTTNINYTSLKPISTETILIQSNDIILNPLNVIYDYLKNVRFAKCSTTTVE